MEFTLESLLLNTQAKSWVLKQNSDCLESKPKKCFEIDGICILDMGLENINLSVRKTEMGMIFISLSFKKVIVIAEHAQK